MLNAVKSELYKVKKNRIFYVCSIMVILAIIWLVFKEFISSTQTHEFDKWIKSLNIFSSLFLSISSGLILTFLIQHEYEHKTIINVLAAPTSRVTFVMSKLVIWFLWYIVILGISIIILLIGGSILFSGDFGISKIQLIFSTVAKTRVLSFVATTPLLLVAILQRHSFYPTIMCAIGFAGMELFALILPIKFSSIIPWSAVMLVGSEIPSVYMVRALVVIFLTGILGVLGACFAFKKQNQ